MFVPKKLVKINSVLKYYLNKNRSNYNTLFIIIHTKIMLEGTIN